MTLQMENKKKGALKEFWSAVSNQMNKKMINKFLNYKS